MAQLTGLETAFYIMGIVFMSLILILLIILVVTVFVIRSKVTTLQQQVEHRIDEFTNLAGKGGEFVAQVGAKAASGTVKTFRKAVRKVKK